MAAWRRTEVSFVHVALGVGHPSGVFVANTEALTMMVLWHMPLELLVIVFVAMPLASSP